MFTDAFKLKGALWLATFACLASVTTLSVIKHVEEQLTVMTPIVVLDRAAVLKNLPINASPKVRDQVTQNLKNLTSRYSQEGFLVLDGSWVLGAPEDVYVHTP
jgi:hypothetical protein